MTHTSKAVLGIVAGATILGSSVGLTVRSLDSRPVRPERRIVRIWDGDVTPDMHHGDRLDVIGIDAYTCKIYGGRHYIASALTCEDVDF